MLVRGSWIRFRVAFRSGVIAPLVGVAGSLKSLVRTPEGKTRWVPVGALVFIVVVSLAGVVIGKVQSSSVQPLPKVEKTVAPLVEPTSAASETLVVLRGSDVELNPETKLTKTGQVPFLVTNSPGELAEAYTRAASTMDMSKDSAQGWLNAFEQWHTSFVPEGFERWAWDENAKSKTRTNVLKVWTNFTLQEPVFTTFSTSLLIDRELSVASPGVGSGIAPKWAAEIDSGQGIHLVRTSWVASAFATKNAENNAPLVSGDGTTEMLIVCPGAAGYTEKSCKILSATDSKAEAPSAVLSEWPAK